MYAIVDEVETEYFLLDVGESFKLRTRIENHCKKDCWIKNSNGKLTIYIHYTPFLSEKGRILIEQELRELFRPEFRMEKKIGYAESIR